MIIKPFETEEEWLDARKGKIMGSRAGNLFLKTGKGKKVGFYEIIAEKISLPATGENPMDRGHRLEPEAIKIFEQETKKVVDSSLVMWVREDMPDIGVSPDGFILNDGEVTEAVEVKCLASARHVEALLKEEIPDEYEAQVIQYFLVNDKLKTLYFCFYDPRLIVKQFFYITVTRAEIEMEIQKQLEEQIQTIDEINKIVSSLTF